eukprot:2746800-Pyramimonas_sp.AAC.1
MSTIADQFGVSACHLKRYVDDLRESEAFYTWTSPQQGASDAGSGTPLPTDRSATPVRVSTPKTTPVTDLGLTSKGTPHTRYSAAHKLATSL